MTTFADAFRQGQDAAERARRNKEEIREVIGAATRELSDATNNALVLFLESAVGGLAPWVGSAAAIMLSQKPIPRETWLGARNLKAEGKPSLRLARFDEANEGYPVTLIYDKKEALSYDREALETAILEFLANAWVGGQLADLLERG
jgi:hypothetical protein